MSVTKARARPIAVRGGRLVGEVHCSIEAVGAGRRSRLEGDLIGDFRDI